MNKLIPMQLNFFGPYLKREDIPKILEQKEIKGTVFESQKDLLEYFFELPLSGLSKEILERYIDVTTEELHIAIAPHSKEIFERLLKPLRSAKKSYCLGDYLATIASCGVVGEMLTILLWKTHEVKIGANPIREEEELGLFGNSVEKLGQEKRLKILKVFKIINEDQYNIFTEIKNNRRPYLHFWSTGEKNEKAVALDTLQKSLGIFKEVTGVKFVAEGKVTINPLLIKLLDHSGG